MCASFNANLFELRTYKPLKVNVYAPEITPPPEKPAHFYQVLGRVAKNLTKCVGTAVISEKGKILVLESSISKQNLVNEIELENIGTFKVNLTLEETSNVGFADSPVSYARLVNKIVDLALVHLSDDYYKYSEMSPYIMERGEGYFDESLRRRIGVEDGRRFYRGLRVVEGAPYLLINREIELRSWKNLLNELKILAVWWQIIKKKEEIVDFYDPPEEFVRFVNWTFRNRTANVKRYPSPPIIIEEITWQARAKDRVLDVKMSPCEYHRKAQGITIEDENQPLVKWKMRTKEGSFKDQFHVPELLVVGHTFRDISMRVSKSQISQVFDILHPHCGDQQRKIFDVVKKIDYVLRSNFTAVYPKKLEFSTFPKDISKNVSPPASIEVSFGDKRVHVLPPYGVNFYRKYSKTVKFSRPLTGIIKTLVILPKGSSHDFIEILSHEIEQRNNCEVAVSYSEDFSVDNPELSENDLVITITNDGDRIGKYKRRLIGELGIAHQNITPSKASEESVPQLAMQITLKLGGRPWLVESPENIDMLSIYSYRNPFSASRFYLFSVMRSNGEILHQSRPFSYEDSPALFDELGKKASEHQRLLIIMSFDDLDLQEHLLRDVASKTQEFVFFQVRKGDELRLFSTFKPSIVAMPRRRADQTIVYPVEAYEGAPQGVIFKASPDEFYMVTTASRKLGTYHRGCPTPIRVKLLASHGSFDVNQILQCILSLSLGSGTSGHETRLPAPLYYLGKYAAFINAYGPQINEKMLQRPFYV